MDAVWIKVLFFRAESPPGAGFPALVDWDSTWGTGSRGRLWDHAAEDISSVEIKGERMGYKQQSGNK